MRFNEFDQGTVGILYIAEMSGCSTHVERITGFLCTVNGKRKTFCFTLLLEVIHPLNIKTQMNESKVAPQPVLKNQLRLTVQNLYQLNCAVAKKPAESARSFLAMAQQYPMKFASSSGDGI